MAKTFLLSNSLAIVIAALFLRFCGADDKVCIKATPCSCQLDHHTRIDITNLTLKHPGFLADTLGEKNLTYFYHGCTNAPFKPEEYGISVANTTKNYCNDTTLCVYNATEQTLKDLGKAQDGVFHAPVQGSKSWELIFKKPNSSTITTIIELVCSDLINSYIKADTPKEPTNLLLFSPLACPIKQHEHHEDNLSTGSVLLILFFTAVGLYFTGGALALHFLRGATGIEMVPNLDFWRDLPYLVRDGTAFLLNGCRPTVSSGADVYDRI